MAAAPALRDGYIAVPPWVIRMMIGPLDIDGGFRNDLADPRTSHIDPPLRALLQAMFAGDVQWMYTGQNMHDVQLDPITKQWSHQNTTWLFYMCRSAYVMMPRRLVEGLETYWNRDWDVANPNRYERFVQIDEHYIRYSRHRRNMDTIYVHMFDPDMNAYVYFRGRCWYHQYPHHPVTPLPYINVRNLWHDIDVTTSVTDLAALGARFFISYQNYEPILPPLGVMAKKKVDPLDPRLAMPGPAAAYNRFPTKAAIARFPGQHARE
jgi:hypothetical protein